MRPRSLHVLLLLCTVLVSGPACVGMKPAPLPPPEVVAASPWKYARVGDRVEYDFSSNLFNPRIPFDFLASSQEPRGRTNTVEGRMAVEVVAVRPPWAWLTLSFTDDRGRPHPNRALSHAYVLPMRMEDSQPRPPIQPPGGTVTEERFTAGGNVWDARRSVKDFGVGEDPRVVRVHAKVPGPLYLTQGLLEASIAPSGMEVRVSTQLKLRSFRQGTLAPGKVPTLEHPLGPGTWYDELTEPSGEAPVLTRSCMSAETGRLLSTRWTGAPGAAPPCGEFQYGEGSSLGNALLGVIAEAAWVFSWWPPVLEEFKPIRQEKFTRGKHAIPATVWTRPWDQEEAHPTEREVRYAVDPWGTELDGLTYWIRFDPLFSGTFHIPAQGPRTLAYSTALEHWGVWWKAAGN